MAGSGSSRRRSRPPRRAAARPAPWPGRRACPGEDGHLHLHRPAVGQRGPRSARARWPACGVAPGTCSGRASAARPAMLAAAEARKLAQRRADARRVGHVGMGNAPGLAAGTARLQRQAHRRTGQRQLRSCSRRLAGHEQGDVPLPSGRTSRQSSAGEQAASRQRPRRRSRREPRVGPKTDIAAIILGRCRRMPAMNPDPPSTPPGALAGVRVLDLSRVLAGPWCTQTLADLGAEVIKVERPPGGGHPGGDDTRGWGPPFLKDRHGHDTAEAAYYLGANRNKRSVTIDIAQPEGQALVLRLADTCDVLVENFKVGDMARYGLDAATLRAALPAAGVLLDHRLRPDRPLPRTRRLRLRRPGHGRPDERHRRARRPARRRPAEGGRGGGRPLHRHVRHGGHPGRAAPPRRHRARARSSTWRCSTPRWRCWPTWAPTTWSRGRRRGAPATRTRTSCPTRCSRWPTAT